MDRIYEEDCDDLQQTSVIRCSEALHNSIVELLQLGWSKSDIDVVVANAKNHG